jgi:hypothetical protein
MFSPTQMQRIGFCVFSRLLLTIVTKLATGMFLGVRKNSLKLVQVTGLLSVSCPRLSVFCCCCLWVQSVTHEPTRINLWGY